MLGFIGRIQAWNSARACGAVVIFSLSFGAAPAAQLDVLHTFTSQSAAGWQPAGELTMDARGALYGTTQFGGSTCPTTQYSCGGTVYKLAPPAQSGGTWKHSVLYSFGGGKDGSNPSGGIILRPSNGILFGTTQYGGVPSCTDEAHGWGCGTAFELVPPAGKGGTWGESIITRFPGGDKGAFPVPRWLQFKDGRLFGATTNGGTNHAGAIVLLTPRTTAAENGPNPIEFIVRYVYAFFHFSNKGSNPFGFVDSGQTYSPPPNEMRGGTGNEGGDGLVTQSDGNESCRCGAISVPHRPGKQDPDWSTEDVYQFRGGCAGALPNYATIGPDGALYGTARGGIDCPAVTSNGCGIAFKFTAATGTQKATYEVLHQFSGGRDGALPIGRLQIDQNGHVFGVTALGGNGCSDSRGCGILYELVPPVPPSTKWGESIRHRFDNPPAGGLLLAKGALYGIGSYDIFRFVP